MQCESRWVPQDGTLLKISLLVYAEMARMTERFLDEQKVVVVDATFYHPAMRDMFLTIAEKRKTDIYFIQVTANESLIEERLKKPQGR